MNSRSKGNRNERVVAKLISNWTGRKFERTPSSGGLQWKSSFSKGDIVCTVDKHYCPFCFEIKAHRDIDFSHLLNPKVKNVKVFEFWNQCRRDAKACGKVPILFMRYNGMPKNFFFIVLSKGFSKYLAEDLSSINFYKKENQLAFTVFQSDQFLKTDYKLIRQLAKTYLNDQKRKS